MVQSSESDFRLIPSVITSTGSVLNQKNRDLNSFGHAIVFALHPTDWKTHRGQPARNDLFIQHKLGLLKYSVLPNEIPELENKLHLRINLFSFDNALGYKRYALYIFKRFYPEEINLLFWEGRYAWIKHISRLFTDTTKYFALTIWLVLFL